MMVTENKRRIRYLKRLIRNAEYQQKDFGHKFFSDWIIKAKKEIEDLKEAEAWQKNLKDN